jgi:hypothetical protein
MRYYSKSEIMHELRINHHRLRRLMDDGGISAQRSTYDKRVWIISEDEYKRLKASYVAGLAELGIGDEVIDLHAKVAELEAQLASRVTRQDDRHVPSLGDMGLTPMGERKATTMRHYSVTQSGYQYDEHGVMAKGSVGRLVALHCRYGEEYARKFLADKMSTDQRMSVVAVLTWLKAYLHHVGRDGDWHECEDEGCACHAL